MRTKTRTIVRGLAVLAVSVATTVVVSAAPADAATNPYNGASACNNDFGGSWTNVNDGHKVIKNDAGSRIGDVYLMYNRATGYNCLTTVKATKVGTKSMVTAHLVVQGGHGVFAQSGNYKYYAAVQAKAKRTCVQYDGEMLSYSSRRGANTWFGGFRTSWGNCGG